MKKLRVCVVTGTRAEFGIWMPVLRAIRQSRLLELKLVVTGMHLLKGFGHTVKEIEKSGFEIAARVPMYDERRPAGISPGAAAESLSRGIEGMAQAYRAVGADIVMVLGDRLEMLAAASAALAERIPIAHLHGGETAPGIWDEQIRHAITKMAHVHFCATDTAGRRILRMGEDPSRVHVVGAPALDQALRMALDFDRGEGSLASIDAALSGGYGLLLLHPSSADENIERERALMAVDAVRRVFPRGKLQVVGPNNDPGHRGILRAYEERKRQVALRLSMPQEQFWGKLLTLGVLVGNSSSGIIEAATFGCAVVNIGDRQAGRERNANVIDVAWNIDAIEKAVRRASTDEGFKRQVARRKNVYGDGKAGGRIVAVLEKFARDGIPREKRFVDARGRR